jgi:hypothetical protein
MNEPLFTDSQRAALNAARDAKLSYGVEVVRAPDGFLLAVLGETHLKGRSASKLGKAIVDAFDVRGVEGFPAKRVFLGRILGFLIALPRVIVRLLSFGLVQDSTIKDARAAKHGHTFALEGVSAVPLGLHVASAYLTLFFTVAFATPLCTALAPFFPPLGAVLPWLGTAAILLQTHMALLIPAYFLRRFSWAWLVHPAIGILGIRDKTMVEGTLAMVKEHGARKYGVAIMGRAHVAGYCRMLVEQHGYRIVAAETDAV